MTQSEAKAQKIIISKFSRLDDLYLTYWEFLLRQSLVLTYIEFKRFIIPENKTKRDLIRMLVQRGYESDPVAAWTKAQEKVHDTHIKDAPYIRIMLLTKL